MAVLTVITTQFDSLKKEYFLLCADMNKPLDEREIQTIKTTSHECFTKSFPDTIETDDINEDGVYGYTIEEKLINLIESDPELIKFIKCPENIKEFNTVTLEGKFCKSMFLILSEHFNNGKE